MKEEPIKNLIKKYNLGKTTLKEEKELFESDAITNESFRKLFNFIKNNKKQAPDNFNENLWNSFEKKTTKPNRFKIGLLATAASIALIVSLYISNTNQNELSYSEKEALLNEAKSMFAATNEVEAYQVLFENELVVVYTKTQ